jgi:hypothetical protein
LLLLLLPLFALLLALLLGLLAGCWRLRVLLLLCVCVQVQCCGEVQGCHVVLVQLVVDSSKKVQQL